MICTQESFCRGRLHGSPVTSSDTVNIKLKNYMLNSLYYDQNLLETDDIGGVCFNEFLEYERIILQSAA